jgi:fumarate hydratase class II
MWKSLITLAVIATAGVAAQAQNTYQANQFRLDTCEVVAQRAAEAYEMKQKGKSYPMDVIPSTAESPISVMHVWAVKFATTDAMSRLDAIKTSMNKCMDNVDSIYSHARSHDLMREDQLQ